MKRRLTSLHFGKCQENALNQMIRKEQDREIYKRIETLPLHCRKVIIMCFLDGFSNMEVADKLNISVHTVRNHKTRALRPLRLKWPPAFSS